VTHDPRVRIVFMGSPDFAVPSLEALVAARHDLALVVSPPAKPVGRQGRLTDPPVARRAKELDLATYQPETLKGEEPAHLLASPAADLFVVVAYGKILRPHVLAIPRLGCVNVHGSVLPRWRGASPVQASLLAGDAETGVSLMRMDAGMDTGPVYRSVSTPVGNDDAAILSARLARMGAGLLVDSLPSIASGALVPAPQDDTRATTCPKISREDGRVDFTRPAEELVRRARAFTPWPGLFAFRAEARVKLSDVTAVRGQSAPGTVLEAGARVVVACGADAIAIGMLQADGRRALPATEFVRGERVAAGEVWT
jgi:methionyl-tRNA formyltransferase